MSASASAIARTVAFAIVLVAFATSTSAATIHLTIKDLEFTPVEITARVGDVIEWSNADIVAHTATAMNGDFDVKIDRAGTASLTLTSPGVVDYYCRYHPNMKATLRVTG
jgi:plastocyanin